MASAEDAVADLVEDEMDDVQIRLIQYLSFVAELTACEISDVCGASGAEIAEALHAPNLLGPPIPKEELLRRAEKIVKRLKEQLRSDHRKAEGFTD